MLYVAESVGISSGVCRGHCLVTFTLTLILVFILCVPYLSFTSISCNTFVNSALSNIDMPHTKTKASDIAVEAKRHYIPHIARTKPECPARSILHADSSCIPVPHDTRIGGRPRITVEDYDPLDLIIHWKESGRDMPVVNMANERRAGGDWESALVAPEECFARRSNLVKALPTPWNYEATSAHYPIPQTGGLYSPSIGKTFNSYHLSIYLSSQSSFAAVPIATKHGNHKTTEVSP